MKNCETEPTQIQPDSDKEPHEVWVKDQSVQSLGRQPKRRGNYMPQTEKQKQKNIRSYVDVRFSSNFRSKLDMFISN